MATKIRKPEPSRRSDRGRPRPDAAPNRGGPSHLWKRLVLGPALPTAQLQHERLGKPTALAVFASDNLSSSAYATEEILKVAVPAVGALAFSLVMPITFAILAVLAVLLFSYRQTIKAYPSAGGAYIVTKDNFGLLTAQLAGVALLTDYVLTVSVSVAAGVAAITSAIPGTFPIPRLDLRLLHLVHRLGQPARGPRVRADVHGPHVLLRRDDVRPPRRRVWRALSAATCNSCRCRRTSPRPRGRSASSSSSTPSLPAVPP